MSRLIGFFAGLMVACSLHVTTAVAATGADGPFLRLETGMHEAIINRIALLPDSDTIVTASDDKTARIWAIADGASGGVIRPPLGEGDDGALYAAAASRRVVALGGRIRGADGRFGVSFFARPDFRPMGVLGALPAAVTALKFSPAGDTIAIGLQNGGVWIINLNTRVRYPDSPDYAGSVTWLDFDASGRLAVAAEDGKVRLYDAAFKREATIALPKGAKPWGIAFSPDGKSLAVGDRGRAAVHLLDAVKPRHERTLEGDRSRGGSLNVVAFASDSRTLYAAGSYLDQKGQLYLRRWDLASRVGSDVPIARQLVTDLVAIPAGLLFATAEPSIGRMNFDGATRFVQSARHLDFRNAVRTSFRISNDGARIELPGGRPGSGPLLFDVIDREFLDTARPQAGLTAPFAAAGGLAVAEWWNSRTPRLNGRLLRLEAAETSRSVAVSADGKNAALGTDFFVRYVNRQTEEWKTPVAAPVWAINISGDGRVIAAALGDGTVHWYSATSGQELLSLFIEPETQRWVVWSPDGFFDHDHRDDGKPDGRELIGYGFNQANGRASDFVEIGQLYPLFFRPDLVGLSFRDTPAARQTIRSQIELMGDVRLTLGRGLPPQIALGDVCGLTADAADAVCPADRLLDSPGGSEAEKLRTTGRFLLVNYALTNPAGGIGKAVVRRNGAVIAPRYIVRSEDRLRREEAIVIPLGSGRNEIKIVPVNATGDVEANDEGSLAFSVTYTPARRRSTGNDAVASAPQAPEPTAAERTLYMLSVGVGSYGHPDLDLHTTVRDATEMARLMDRPSLPVYGKPSVKILVNETATASNIVAALKDIAAKAQPDDLVMIFFAGHGKDVDGKYTFAPFGFGTENPELLERAMREDDEHVWNALLRKEGLGQDLLLPLMHAIPASRMAVILDTCFSGFIATQDAVLQKDVNSRVTSGVGHASGRFVLSGAVSYALDDGVDASGRRTQNGMFTTLLLEAFRGDADKDGTKLIDVYKLATYTSRNITERAGMLKQKQHATYFFNGNQFFDLYAVPSAD